MKCPHRGRRLSTGSRALLTDSRSVWLYEASDVREQGGWWWTVRRRRPWLGWSGCCGGPLSWPGFAPKREGPRSSRQLVALGIDLAAEEARNLLPDGVDVAGPTPVGDDEVGLLRSAEQLLGTIIGVPALGMRRVFGCGSLIWWGRRTPMPALIDAHRRSCWPRTISCPGSCCSRSAASGRRRCCAPSPILVEAAARLWSVLPGAGQTAWPGVDPMFRLVAVARGIDRARDGGLWPGEGPSDERLLIMAGNFTRAAEMINNSVQRASRSTRRRSGRFLLMAGPRPCTSCTWPPTGSRSGSPSTPPWSPSSCAATVSARSRRRSAYDPGEPDAARAMISRLDVFEQIAGHYLFGSSQSAGERAVVGDGPVGVGVGGLGHPGPPQPRRPSQPAEPRLRRPRPSPHRHHQRGRGRSRRADRPDRQRRLGAVRDPDRHEPGRVDAGREPLVGADQPGRPHRPEAARRRQ